jgi:hypothetical protein
MRIYFAAIIFFISNTINCHAGTTKYHLTVSSCNSSEINAIFTEDSFFVAHYRLPVEYFLPLEIRHGAIDHDHREVLEDLFKKVSDSGEACIPTTLLSTCAGRGSLSLSIEKISDSSYAGYQARTPLDESVHHNLQLLLTGIMGRRIEDVYGVLSGDIIPSKIKPDDFLLLRTENHSAWDSEYCYGFYWDGRSFSYCIGKDNKPLGIGTTQYFRTKMINEPFAETDDLWMFNRRYLLNPESKSQYHTIIAGVIEQRPLSFVMKDCREDSAYLAFKEINAIFFEGSNEVLRSFRPLEIDLQGDGFSDEEIQWMKRSIACSQIRSFEETKISR